MIDIKELRLGNIFWDSYNGYNVVTAIGCNKVGDAPNTVIARHIYGTLSGQYECDNIEPIPLTPELLLKMGFTRGDYHTNHFYHTGMNGYIQHQSDGYQLEIGDDLIISELFNFIHQLQNIFYFLNNEELNYQP